ncbi:MAG: hypothetical protein A2Y76_07570 [Planctomycetes bacterium RBG_13_60_9]|nr:MAG: hypothetical protein A2Y76_07570 [Planctomycetes bacterium RBG_13_60_9]
MTEQINQTVDETGAHDELEAPVLGKQADEAVDETTQETRQAPKEDEKKTTAGSLSRKKEDNAL